MSLQEVAEEEAEAGGGVVEPLATAAVGAEVAAAEPLRLVAMTTALIVRPRWADVSESVDPVSPLSELHAAPLASQPSQP